MAQALITLHDVVVRYDGKVALDIDSLAVHAGERLAILGPNGAGKSTLLRIMGLLQAGNAGTIRLRGEQCTEKSPLELRRQIATVFAEPSLLNDTLYANAALGLKLRGVGSRETSRRLNPWLERLKIAHLANRHARTLSSGEAQRTSLARALALEPELLLLDEPFAALDPTGRESMLRDFRNIMAESGITTVFVTHDRAEAFTLADRVAILIDGQIAQIGSRDEVYQRPASEAIAELVGIENRLHGEVVKAQGTHSIVRIGKQQVILPGTQAVETHVVLCIRAEHIALAAAAEGHCDTYLMRGVITAINSELKQIRCMISCDGFELTVAVAPEFWVTDLLKESSTVFASFKAERIHIIPAAN